MDFMKEAMTQEIISTGCVSDIDNLASIAEDHECSGEYHKAECYYAAINHFAEIEERELEKEDFSINKAWFFERYERVDSLTEIVHEYDVNLGEIQICDYSQAGTMAVVNALTAASIAESKKTHRYSEAMSAIEAAVEAETARITANDMIRRVLGRGVAA